MSDPRKLFVGLLPDDAVRTALVEHQSRWYWGDGRPTAPARLHLTLHFIGAVDSAHEWALQETLAGESVAPFDIVLRTPQRWSGGVAVICPDAQVALFDLQTQLAKPLLRAGLRPHPEPFNPHVTLARRAERAEPPEASAPITWTVRDFALIWSHAGGYEPLARYGAL